MFFFLIHVPAKEANFIFKSLAELINRTKLKVCSGLQNDIFINHAVYTLFLNLTHNPPIWLQSVCNLGVWCISIQQLDADILAVHFQSLLLAVTHALDNPNGSLSTTFEAIQVQLHFDHLYWSFYTLSPGTTFVWSLILELLYLIYPIAIWGSTTPPTPPEFAFLPCKVRMDVGCVCLLETKILVFATWVLS